MSAAAYSLKEFGHNLYRNPGTVLGSFLSLALLFVLFDLYWIAAGTSDRFYYRLLSDLKVEVFVSEETPDSTLSLVQQAIETVDGIRSITYVSREDARQELSRMLGVDLLVGYDSVNPLPRSFVLDFTPAYLTTERMAETADLLQIRPGVEQVIYSRQWLEKAESAKTLIRNIGMALGALILLTALITSINSIRLSSRARAVGFRQMRLLGAGKLFLASPFLIEGLLVGGLSAAAGWAVILYAGGYVTFTRFDLVLPAMSEIVTFCCITAVLGTVSGYFGVRSLLR